VTTLVAERSRRRLGAWYTPEAVVERVVEQVVANDWLARRSRPLRVLDPACGDGRFLQSVARRVRASGGTCEAIGVDIDGTTVADARRRTSDVTFIVGDALARSWTEGPFDLVIGNPPFLSQLAASTSRGGSSRHGGGPYADAAVEFLALSAELVDPAGGRVAFVLPQSVLAARDAGPVRRAVDERATLVWSWAIDEMVFDAQVRTCVLAFEFDGRCSPRPTSGRRDVWAAVLTPSRAIPDLPDGAGLETARTLADRAWLNANFRDEYYGMIAAVGDHEDGPPLITSGSIDPGRSLWGRRPVTFAKRRFAAPRVDVGALDDRMRRWARRRLAPKVLIANQTPIIEAICDPTGELLPGVPVVGAYPLEALGLPSPADAAWQIAAVLTSPFASAWAWHRAAGTGLSSGSIRLGPAMLADLPWPGGELTDAVDALRGGDVRACGRAADRAWGIADDSELCAWWERALERIERRQPV
jgi:SAM-dependent methyltransferase